MVSTLRSFIPLRPPPSPLPRSARAPPTETAPVTLAVAGRANAHVSIAARDALVVAAWGASRDGAADVYAAVSRDGGRSFGAPIRVNATAGEAALGGERAPRVATAPRQGRASDRRAVDGEGPPARGAHPRGAQPKPDR